MNYRAKMEKHLGRKLKRSEEVHHKDGNQHNNRLSNLQIVEAGKEHRILDSKVKVNWKKKLNQLPKSKKFKVIELTELLSVFFTERQQYIIYRRLNKLPLSKTEKEYYSRTIKPKLKAIANPQLHRISENLVWTLM